MYRIILYVYVYNYTMNVTIEINSKNISCFILYVRYEIHFRVPMSVRSTWCEHRKKSKMSEWECMYII